MERVLSAHASNHKIIHMLNEKGFVKIIQKKNSQKDSRILISICYIFFTQIPGMNKS